MRNFEIGDTVLITKGLFQGHQGVVKAKRPSINFRGKYVYILSIPNLTKDMYRILETSNDFYGEELLLVYRRKCGCPEILDVIFNHPATIVFWSDGTKTIVKCQNDETFDAEKGLTMAIAKKVMGNKGNYFDNIKKWTERGEKEE